MFGLQYGSLLLVKDTICCKFFLFRSTGHLVKLGDDPNLVPRTFDLVEDYVMMETHRCNVCFRCNVGLFRALGSEFELFLSKCFSFFNSFCDLCERQSVWRRLSSSSF